MNEVLAHAAMLLIYSGPLLPLGATLFFRRRSIQHFKRNRLLFCLLMGVQALSFAPYVLAEIAHNPDALEVLFYPALVSALLFTGTAVYLVYECRYFFLETRREQ